DRNSHRLPPSGSTRPIRQSMQCPIPHRAPAPGAVAPTGPAARRCRGMRHVATVGLGILFALGAILGVAIGVVIFPISWRRRARTNAGDYLANGYSTVTPWWLAHHGPVILRLIAPPPAAAARGADRLARLDADLAADRARFGLAVDTGSTALTIGELRLIARL